MADQEMVTWVKAQLYQIGFDKKGQFIGKKVFRRKLGTLRPGQVERIALAVKKVGQDGLFVKPQPPPVPAKSSPSISKPGAVAKASPITAEKKILTPKSVKDHLAKLAKRESVSQGAHSFEDHKTYDYGTLDSENGGVIVSVDDEYSSSERSAVSQKVKDLQDFVKASSGRNGKARVIGTPTDLPRMPNLDDQMELLNLHDTGNPDEQAATDDVENAVLFSAKLLDDYDSCILPQYGLLGSGNTIEISNDVRDPRIFLNTNIPFSAFVCGVQGSGKSHTTSCLIENCLISSSMLGVLQNPLSALVFHYDEASSHESFKPSEVAFLASPNPSFPNQSRVSKINVLVSPSNYLTLQPLYSQIPGVTVQRFKLHPKNLNIDTMLTLMSVDTSDSTPLYMSQVTKILRDMATNSSKLFSYLDFKRQLGATKFDRKQIDFLNQRLELLESFLDLDNTTPSPVFEAGTITIIDLSCPFVDVNTACVLFKIGAGMYRNSNATTGKLIAVDEAHKYLTTSTPAADALTKYLITTIREQRHYGVRIIISTQEPTVNPLLIDLCSMVIVHRFSSPEWFRLLKKRISIAEDTDNSGKELFHMIVALKTGEAMVFALSAIVGNGEGGWEKLNEGMLRVRVRKRLTWDGGRSVVAV